MFHVYLNGIAKLLFGGCKGDEITGLCYRYEYVIALETENIDVCGANEANITGRETCVA